MSSFRHRIGIDLLRREARDQPGIFVERDPVVGHADLIFETLALSSLIRPVQVYS